MDDGGVFVSEAGEVYAVLFRVGLLDVPDAREGAEREKEEREKAKTISLIATRLVRSRFRHSPFRFLLPLLLAPDASNRPALTLLAENRPPSDSLVVFLTALGQ